MVIINRVYELLRMWQGEARLAVKKNQEVEVGNAGSDNTTLFIFPSRQSGLNPRGGKRVTGESRAKYTSAYIQGISAF